MMEALKSGFTIWGTFIVFIAFGPYALLGFVLIVIAAIVSIKVSDYQQRKKRQANRRDDRRRK